MTYADVSASSDGHARVQGPTEDDNYGGGYENNLPEGSLDQQTGGRQYDQQVCRDRQGAEAARW